MKEEEARSGNNTCVCCGETIPEGRQICPKCEVSAHGYQYYPPKKRLRERIRDALRALKG